MKEGNLTSNTSGAVMRRGKTLDFAIPYTIASGTFSFVGGVSNLFVMFILLKYVRLKHNTYMYMFSLFLSDFLYNCVVQPHICYYQFPSAVRTVFGSKYIHAAGLVCLLTGSSSLFFASFDKFIFIRHPFFYGNYITKRKTRVVVLCIWLACLALGVVRFHGIVFIKDGYLAIIAASFVLTILVQIMIFVTAREQDKRIQQLHRSLEHNHPRGDVEDSVVQPHANQSSNKAAKTIGLMLVVYVASWLPVNIYRQEYRWNGGDPVVYHKWMKIVNLMIQLHSCINPWVFVLRSKDMKNAIPKFLRALGVSRDMGSERSSEVIVGGNKLTASSRCLDSNGGISERGDKNNQLQEVSVQTNGEIHTAGEKIEGRVNTSYRNSCGNNGNIMDAANNESSSSQSESIQEDYSSDNKNVTLENVERKRDERNNGNDNNLNKITTFNKKDSTAQRIVNDVSGIIENQENMENNDNRETNSGNNNSLKKITVYNINENKEERVVNDVSGSIQNQENIESNDNRETNSGNNNSLKKITPFNINDNGDNVIDISMRGGQNADIHTRNNESKDEEMINNKNDTQYVENMKKDKSSADNKLRNETA